MHKIIITYIFLLVFLSNPCYSEDQNQVNELKQLVIENISSRITSTRIYFQIEVSRDIKFSIALKTDKNKTLIEKVLFSPVEQEKLPQIKEINTFWDGFYAEFHR